MAAINNSIAIENEHFNLGAYFAKQMAIIFTNSGTGITFMTLNSTSLIILTFKFKMATVKNVFY